jgi:hypothetical protein
MCVITHKCEMTPDLSRQHPYCGLSVYRSLSSLIFVVPLRHARIGFIPTIEAADAGDRYVL